MSVIGVRSKRLLIANRVYRSACGPRRWHFLLGLPAGAVCAEIGVFRGEFTRSILEVTKPGELHLIDAWWERYGDHYPAEWGAFSDYGRLSTRRAYDDAAKVVAAAPPSSRVTTHVGDDCEILETFADGNYDRVYLDTSHQYEDTVRELDLLSRKVKPDGFIAGDDWWDDPRHVWAGAGVAIDEFCLANGWRVDRRDVFTQWRISRRGS